MPIPPDRVQRSVREERARASGLGRDGAARRCNGTPPPIAGFSDAEPWLPLADDYTSRNVENERNDNTSIYNLYRRLVAARRGHRALLIGSYRPVVASGELLLFVRSSGRERILVTLNLGAEATTVTFAHGGFSGVVLVSSFGDRDGEKIDGSIDLRPDEGFAILVEAGVEIPESVA